MTTSSSDSASIEINGRIGEGQQKCSRCYSFIPYELISKHTDKYCELNRWRRREAAKYDMISIWHVINKEINFQYVTDELRKMYPKVISKVFDCLDEENRAAMDIFVEKKEADTIDQYIKAGGYAGLSLAEFLEKTIAERQANVAPKEG